MSADKAPAYPCCRHCTTVPISGSHPTPCLECGQATPVVAQRELELVPLVHPDHVKGATIQERFEAFHAANPWVLTAPEKLTREQLEAGARRLGIGMLWEVVRWQYGSATRGEQFKANNDFRSRYVRLMCDRHPEWEVVFATRELRTA